MNIYEFFTRLTHPVKRIGWYLFYPGDDPDPEEIKDTSMRIRYMKRRPWIFENIDSM